MLLVEPLLAFLIAVVLAWIVVGLFGRQAPGPGSGLVFLSLFLFLSMWAVGLWLTPVGPVLWGVPFLGLLITGLILALIIAASVPPRREPPPSVTRPEAETAEAVAVTMGAFFYVAMFLLLAVVVAGYLVGS